MRRALELDPTDTKPYVTLGPLLLYRLGVKDEYVRAKYEEHMGEREVELPEELEGNKPQ